MKVYNIVARSPWANNSQKWKKNVRVPPKIEICWTFIYFVILRSDTFDNTFGLLKEETAVKKLHLATKQAQKYICLF